MKGLLLAAAVVALAIGGVFLLGRGDPPETTEDATRVAGGATGAARVAKGATEVPGPTPDETWANRVHTNVPGCRVTLEVSYYGAEPDPDRVVKTADGEGFAGFPRSAHPELVARAYGQAEAPGYAPAVDRVKDGEVRLTLERSFAVRGHVLEKGGGPVCEALVHGRYRRAVTDAAGRYVLSGLPEDEVELACGVARAKLTVPAGAEGVDFIARRHLVVVRVADVAGRPYKNAGLAYQVRRGEENAGSRAGNVDWGEAMWFDPGVRVFFTPCAPDCATRSTHLEFGETPRRHELDLVLRPEDPPGSIALRATDEEGRPVHRARATLTLEGGALAGGWYNKEVELDERGDGILDGVPPGALYLEITTSARHFSPEGYGMTSRVPVVVTSGGTTHCAVTIPTGGRVRVTVRDKTGKVVAPGRLDLLGGDGKRVRVIFLQILEAGGWVTGSSQGIARPALLSRPVPEGRYRVTLEREGEVVAGQDVAIRKGITAQIEIRLDREEKVDEDAEKHLLGDG